MLRSLKRALYFPVASYFRFFASLRLKKWDPKIVVITGSQGKTTLLHMIEAELGDKAVYSHRANSSFGVPFHILGLHRKSFKPFEWVIFFFKAPVRVFSPLPSQKIYVVEADCDRTGEGKFLATLLRPNITLWVSSSRTHSINIIRLKGESIEDATAREFSEFAKHTKDLVVANGDVLEIVGALESIKVKKILVREGDYLSKFTVNETTTDFTIGSTNYSIPFLVPKEVSRAIVMTEFVCKEFNIEIDTNFSNLVLPPGRSSIFSGVKNRLLVDSTYNTSLESTKAMLELFVHHPRVPKWVVLGDMLELGEFEKDEHKRLASVIEKYYFERVILVGPRLRESTYPKLLDSLYYKDRVVSFLGPNEVWKYIESESKGGEAILFKGARFLEGVVEKLLSNKDDIKNLPRREKMWNDRRKKWKI